MEWGCSKTNKGKQQVRGGGGGSKLGSLERTYFLNAPYVYIDIAILLFDRPNGLAINQKFM